IGSAALFGYVLPENFDAPYLSSDLQEFWRRWHMSLSTWLRDYLYKPLGGSRGGALKTYRNLMLTMVLGGLWHGAAWTFVIWGAFHGTLLVVEHALGGRLRAPGWLRWLVTFHLVVLGWIVFRAQSIGDVWTLLKRFASLGSPTLLTVPV